MSLATAEAMPLPDPIEICLEDLDHPQFVRCVALPGGEPGLGVRADGAVLWRSDEAHACEFWVSVDGRLVLLRPTGASAVVVRRAGRFVEAPCEKPVMLLHQDVVEVAGRRLRVHVHGVAGGIAPPTILTGLVQAASAVALGGALLLGGLTGCAEENGGPQVVDAQATQVASSGNAVAAVDAGATVPSPPPPRPPDIMVRENSPKPMARDPRNDFPGIAPAVVPPPAVVPTPAAQLNLRGKVDVLAPEVESDAINREQLTTYIRKRSPALLRCYEQELKRNPSLKGKLVLRFNITPTGRTTEIDVEENTLGSEAVASCARTAIRSWVLPFKPQEEVPVASAFVFARVP